MNGSRRAYLIVLSIVWIGLAIAATIYSRRYPAHSHWIMTGVFPAFCVESVLFLAAGFESIREWFRQKVPRPARSAILWISALIPFAIVTTSAGTFEPHAFYLLAALCGVLSFWALVFPARPVYDIGFLCVAAAPIALKVFPRLYVTPVDGIRIDALGHLMWIHLATFVLLLQRNYQVGPVGFWPTLREWQVGLKHFLLAVVPVVAVALLVRFVVFAPRHLTNPWLWIGLAVGYFFGIFWVVAFSEDIFRGVLTRMMLHWKWGQTPVIIASGILVGAAHLWYRDFPNWRYGVSAAVAHGFYTLAYLRGGSIRASMVAHAMTVTTWRMFFATP